MNYLHVAPNRDISRENFQAFERINHPHIKRIQGDIIILKNKDRHFFWTYYQAANNSRGISWDFESEKMIHRILLDRI
jgi:hypothetical protein